MVEDGRRTSTLGAVRGSAAGTLASVGAVCRVRRQAEDPDPALRTLFDQRANAERDVVLSEADGEGDLEGACELTMPRQKPGNSRQDYGTPENFLAAVKARLHIKAFTFDFAADDQNHKAAKYWTKKDDSLSRVNEWSKQTGRGWGFLNPEFSDIAPWAEACAHCVHDGGSVALLTPLSSSNWFLDFVHHRALVLALNGRLCFVDDWQHTIDPSPKNKTGACYQSAPLYPKDCMLSLFSPLVAPGFDVWAWKEPKCQ